MSLVAGNTIELDVLSNCLTAEEVIGSFFESFEPEYATLLLREARDIVMKKEFSTRNHNIEEEYMRFFFEKLEQMMEAAYLLK